MSNSDIADAGSVEVGDHVVAPVGKDNHQSVAKVVKIEYFAEDNVPLPLDKTKHIIRKCADDDDSFDDDDVPLHSEEDCDA